MKSKLLAATAALALAVAGGHAASAKTLVYCSEGSPENFYPAINTTGTSFDASSRPIYNRLVARFGKDVARSIIGRYAAASSLV